MSQVFESLTSFALMFLKTLQDHFLNYWSPAGVYAFLAIIPILVLGRKFNFVFDHAQLTGVETKKYKFFAWLFPRKILLGRGLRQDIFFTFLNLFLALVLLQWGMKSMIDPLGFGFLVIHQIADILHLSVATYTSAQNNFGIDLLFVFVVLIASNLGSWIGHYLLHRVSFLWEFHKVHHSAPHLTGFTNDRVHFVEKLFSIWTTGFMMALGILLFELAARTTPSGYANSAALIVYAVVISPTNFLLHAPYWISFGPLEYLVTSPAMHSIHHSIDSGDFNKNFSTGLSIFDLAFGTFKKATRKPPPDFQVGLKDDFNWQQSSVWRILARPFWACIKK